MSRLPCSSCSKDFANSKTLENHVLKFHPIAQVQQPIPEVVIEEMQSPINVNQAAEQLQTLINSRPSFVNESVPKVEIFENAPISEIHSAIPQNLYQSTLYDDSASTWSEAQIDLEISIAIRGLGYDNKSSTADSSCQWEDIPRIIQQIPYVPITTIPDEVKTVQFDSLELCEAKLIPKAGSLDLLLISTNGQRQILKDVDIRKYYGNKVAMPADFTEVKLNDYIRNTNQSPNVAHPKFNAHNQPFRNKILNDLAMKVKFAFPKPEAISEMYYSIKSYDILNAQIKPDQESITSKIGLIQVLNICDNVSTNHVLINGTYDYNSSLLSDTNSKIVHFATEQDMCNYFVQNFCIQGDKTIFALGFKSSSATAQSDLKINYNSIYGQDLNFIIKRSSYKPQSINKRLTVGQKRGYNATIGFKEIPNMFILDTQVMLREMLNNKQEAAMSKFDIQSYFKTFDQTHQVSKLGQLNDTKTRSGLSDMKSDIGCIIDQTILDLKSLSGLIEKIGFFNTKRVEMSEINMPLSISLFETSNNKNQCKLAQLLMADNRLPAFWQMDQSQEKKTYEGPLQFTEKLYENIVTKFNLCHDFASLYPNIIIANNISPETLRFEPTENCIAIDLSGDKNFPPNTIVYFDQSVIGCIPALCKYLIQKRKEIRENMKNFKKGSMEWEIMNSQQLLIKVMVNAIYGGMGQQANPYYNQFVAASVTAKAREYLTILKKAPDHLFGLYKQQTRAVMGVTDSVMWIADDLFENKLIEDRETIFKDLQRKINQYLMEQGLAENLTVECEEIGLQFSSTCSAVAYFRHEQTTSNFYSGSNDYKLVVKGAPLNQMSEYVEKVFLDTMSQALLESDLKPTQIVDKVIVEQSKQIMQAMQDKNRSFISNFAIKHKTCSKSRAVKEMMIKYGDQLAGEDFVKCVKMRTYDKKIELAPIDLLQDSQMSLIDVNTLCDQTISAFKKYFAKPDEKKNFNQLHKIKLQDEQQDGMILFYSDTAIATRVSLGLGTPEDLYQTALTSKSKAYHEVLDGIDTPCRLYFDYDSATLDFPLDQFQQVYKQTLTSMGVQQEIPFRVIDGSREGKYSKHIFGDLVVNRSIMKVIAQKISKRVKGIDLAIYGDQGESHLRIIGSIKFKDGLLMTTRFKLPQNVKPHQCFATYTKDLPTLLNIPMFDNKPIFDFGIQVVVPISKEVDEIITDLGLNVEKHHKGSQYFLNPIKTPFQCPMCKKSHEKMDLKISVLVNENSLSFACLRDTNKEKLIIKYQHEKTDDPVVHIQMPISVKEQCIRYDEQVHTSSIQYDFKRFDEVLAVKSALGTGKTHTLIELLKKTEQTIIVSSRITFTKQLTSRLQEAGIQVENYKQIEGAIKMKPGVIIVQYESLNRIVGADCQLLVLDECESIFEQVNSKLAKDTTAQKLKFLALLQGSSQILVLDGQLKQDTINQIQYQTSRPVRVILNTYKPYDKQPLTIHEFKDKKNVMEFIKLIDEKLRQGKRVYSYCSSLKVIELVWAHCKKEGLPLPRIYHGKNIKLEDELNEEGKQKTHQKIKDEHFSRLKEEWVKHQIVMCSPTVGAGCDFNEEHFDVGIHLYMSDNKSSPQSFTQGCFRVRKLKDKENHVFLSTLKSQPREVSPISQQYVYISDNELPNVSPLMNLDLHLAANQKAMQSASQHIIVANLQLLGFIPQLNDHTQQTQEEEMKDTKHQTNIDKLITKGNLNSKDIDTITIKRSSYRYFTSTDAQKADMIQKCQIEENCPKELRLLALIFTVQPENKAFKDTDEDYEIVKNKLQQLRVQYPESGKLISINKLTEQHKTYKKQFGNLIDSMSKSDAVKHVKEVYKAVVAGYNNSIATKGTNLKDLKFMCERVTLALDLYHIPTEDQRKEYMKLHDIKSSSAQTLYAYLGIYRESKNEQVYTKTDPNAKAVREIYYTYIHSNLPSNQ